MRQFLSTVGGRRFASVMIVLVFTLIVFAFGGHLLPECTEKASMILDSATGLIKWVVGPYVVADSLSKFAKDKTKS